MSKIRPIKDDFTKENFKSLVWEFYNAMTTITLGDNFSAQIIENIVIPANTEVKIAHKLGSIPKYRIIVRCSGANDIVDGTTAWNSREIYLKNINTTVESTVSVMIVRG